MAVGVLWFFLVVQWAGLRCVVVVFPGRVRSLFFFGGGGGGRVVMIMPINKNHNISESMQRS